MTNTGPVAGTETAQAYLTLPAATGEPGKRLVGFDQVTLKPGKSTRVTITIDGSAPDRPLSFWDTTTHNWATSSGSYGVQVGSSSRTLPLSGSFPVK